MITAHGAKSAVQRMTRMHRVRPAKRRNGVVLGLVGAAVVALLVFLIDRAGRMSRFAPVREHLRHWYLASSGRLDTAWSQLREVPPDDATAAA